MVSYRDLVRNPPGEKGWVGMEIGLGAGNKAWTALPPSRGGRSKFSKSDSRGKSLNIIVTFYQLGSK